MGEPFKDNHALPLLEALGEINSLENLSLVLASHVIFWSKKADFLELGINYRQKFITAEQLFKETNIFKKLGNWFCRVNNSVTQVDFHISSCKKITQEGVERITEVLRELTHLESLDLNFGK